MSVAAVRGAEAVTPLPLVLRETRVSAADGTWACGLESLAPNPRSFDVGRVPVFVSGAASHESISDRSPAYRTSYPKRIGLRKRPFCQLPVEPMTYGFPYTEHTSGSRSILTCIQFPVHTITSYAIQRKCKRTLSEVVEIIAGQF